MSKWRADAEHRTWCFLCEPCHSEHVRSLLVGKTHCQVWSPQQLCLFAKVTTRNTLRNRTRSPSLQQSSVHPHSCGAGNGCWWLLGWGTEGACHHLPKDSPAVLYEKLHQPLPLHRSNHWVQPRWLKTDHTAFPIPDPCFCAESCSCGAALAGNYSSSICSREQAARYLWTAKLWWACKAVASW